ncbi:hypothetical protein BC937DRAFT_94628, partial [Endogone sp. FLAS-F59071]
FGISPASVRHCCPFRESSNCHNSPSNCLVLLDKSASFFFASKPESRVDFTLHDMAPTSINTFLRIPIFRRNDDKRYSYSTVPSEDSDSDEDCLMDVISNDGSSVLWRQEEDEKKCKFARYCCCGLSIVTLLVLLTAAIYLLLGLMLLSEVKSQFGIDKQIQEFQSLLEKYHPLVRDTTPFMQYGGCPATEIQWNGQLKYESVARTISIQHIGNIAHGKLTVKQGDVDQTTVNLNILLSNNKLQSQVNVEWETQEDYSQMNIDVPIKSGWNTKCVQLDVEVIFPRTFNEAVSLSVASLPDHDIVVEGDGLIFRDLSLSVRNGGITFMNTQADTISAETWNGVISGLVTMSRDLRANVANGVIDLGVDILPTEQKSVNIDAQAWLNGPVSLNLTSAFNGPFSLDTSFIATAHVEHESLDLQQDFSGLHNRVGFKGERAQRASGRVHMKSLTDDVTLRFVNSPITQSS